MEHLGEREHDAKGAVIAINSSVSTETQAMPIIRLRWSDRDLVGSAAD
jgi:hypothetical protein